MSSTQVKRRVTPYFAVANVMIMKNFMKGWRMDFFKFDSCSHLTYLGIDRLSTGT